MSDSAEEQEATDRNRQIIEKLREVFQASELARLTHEVEPAMMFSPAAGEENAK